MKQHTSTIRVLEIIESLAQYSETTIDKIVEDTKIPYTTVYRILQTCIRLGYVDFANDHKYTLSQKLFHVTSTYLHKHCSLSSIAHPIIEELSYTVKETLHLGILEGNKILYVDKIDSQHTFRMHSYIGYQAEIHCTGLGKIITSYLSDLKQKEILDNITYTIYTPNTIENKNKLASELKKVKNQGYAEDMEENEFHLYCIAVPVFDSYSKIVGALSTSMLLFRFDPKQKQFYLKQLWACAEKISHKLGCTDYYTHIK